MPERGFTLLEIMLVIFLIGLASSGVVQTFATDSEPPAKKAAQDFLTRFAQCKDRAVIEGQTAVLQIASGALSNQQILEEKTVAGWVAENQTALLYLMTREQRAVRQQGESDMAGSRWYWRTTPLSTGNALLQAVDIEVSLHEDFSSVIQSRRAWFSAVGGQQ
ncbi:type II secretion system protein GspI [Escherichia coli]|nr:type II secretion system protein GspI [Escherichia coli]